MKRSYIFLMGGTGLISMLLGGYLLYSPDKRSDIQALIIPEEIPQTDQSLEQYKEYAKAKAQEFVEKEYETSVTAEVATPDKENVKNSTWVLAVPFNSIQSDLMITDGKDETPWMDHVRFDRELIEFEKAEKANLPQVNSQWEVIVSNPDFSMKMIDQIQNVSAPYYTDVKIYFEKVGLNAQKLIGMLDERYGKGLSGAPERLKFFYQYQKDLFYISEAIIGLVNNNIRIKQETVKAIQSKDAGKAVTAANDEDRVTLVTTWHEERYKALMALHDEMGKLLQTEP